MTPDSDREQLDEKLQTVDGPAIIHRISVLVAGEGTEGRARSWEMTPSGLEHISVGLDRRTSK